MSEANNFEHDPNLVLDPPTADLLGGGGDVELWTFRVPVLFNVSSLHGMELNLRQLEDVGERGIDIAPSSTTSDSTDNPKIDSSNKTSEAKSPSHSIVLGDTIENKSFRVLIPNKSTNRGTDPNNNSGRISTIPESAIKAAPEKGTDGDSSSSGGDSSSSSDEDSDDDLHLKDDSSDDDDSDASDSDSDDERTKKIVNTKTKKKVKIEEKDDDNNDAQDDDNDGSSSSLSDGRHLYVSTKPFTRHFNVIKSFPHMSETQMAPLKGPKPSNNIRMRRAYTPIPQRDGLKRRWMPPGKKVESSGDALVSSQFSSKNPGKTISSSVKTTNHSSKRHRSTSDASESVSTRGVDPPAKKSKRTTTDEQIQVPGSSTSEDQQQQQMFLTKEEEKAIKKAAKREKKEKKEKKQKKEKKKKDKSNHDHDDVIKQEG